MQLKLSHWIVGSFVLGAFATLVSTQLRSRMVREHQSEGQASVAMEADEAPHADDYAKGSGATQFDASNPAPDLHGAKLVKTGSISLKAADQGSLNDVRPFLRTLSARYHAYFAKEEEQREGGRQSLSFVIRVPADQFDSLVDELSSGSYRTLSKSVEVADETQHFVDLEARLKNRRALLERYRDLLRRGTKVNDLLSINQSMENVSSEIDSLEGQLRYLSSQITYSTLNVSVSVDLPHLDFEPKSFATELKVSVGEGLDSLRGWVLWFASCWFLVVLFVPALPIVVALRKRSARAR